MTEEELQRKRQEFRDQEVMNKITEYGTAAEFRQQTLRTNYTVKRVEKKFGKIGWFLVIAQAVSLLFFCSLFVFSYVPKTKFIVTMVMP